MNIWEKLLVVIKSILQSGAERETNILSVDEGLRFLCENDRTSINLEIFPFCLNGGVMDQAIIRDRKRHFLKKSMMTLSHKTTHIFSWFAWLSSDNALFLLDLWWTLWSLEQQLSIIDNLVSSNTYDISKRNHGHY